MIVGSLRQQKAPVHVHEQQVYISGTTGKVVANQNKTLLCRASDWRSMNNE